MQLKGFLTTPFRDFWLGLPYPIWTLSSCKPFSPWCLIDDLAHAWFPWTFCGHWATRVDQAVDPWICRKHSASVDAYYRKKDYE